MVSLAGFKFLPGRTSTPSPVRRPPTPPPRVITRLDSQASIATSSRRGVAAERAGLRRGTPEWDAFIMRFREGGGRPGDERTFIHKKILGGIGRVAGLLPIPGASLIGTVARRLSGRTVPRTQTARPTTFSAAEKELGRTAKFGPSEQKFQQLMRGGRQLAAVPGVACLLPGFERDAAGNCRWVGFLGDRPGPDEGVPVGDAIMGQYGAGLVPGSLGISRAVCLRGMQLGNDGICYNKSQISNKQRMWPAGRKPLLTGGDMRAISTAARAGKRMDLATKRLQKMGMMKKPARRVGPTRHAALLEAHVGSKHQIGA